jgi:hypothetical protein
LARSLSIFRLLSLSTRSGGGMGFRTCL